MTAFQSSAFQGTAFQSSAGGPNTYTAVVSGGITSAGTAGITRIRSTLVSGGLVSAGAGGITRVRTSSVSGGVNTSGSAGISRTRSPVVSSGAVFGGASNTYKTVLGGNTFTYSPVGGVFCSGAALLKRTRRLSPSSTGLQSSGFAGVVYSSPSAPRSYVYIGSGGAAFAGNAVYSPAHVYRVSCSGGFLLSGQCWFDYVTSTRRNVIYASYSQRVINVVSLPRVVTVQPQSREILVTTKNVFR